MKTRLYTRNDLDTVLNLFYENVHHVCKDDYSPEQLSAWAPQEPDKYRWEASLDKCHTLVCEKNDHVVGFGSIGETGYIDYLYVDYHYLHQGVASLLLEQLEKYAKAKGILYLNTAASLNACPFFEKNGYVVIKEQSVERHGVRLSRYLMEKKI